MGARFLHRVVLPLALVTGGCSVVGYPAPAPPGPAGTTADAPGSAAPERPAPSGGDAGVGVEPPSPYGNPRSYEIRGEVYHVLPSAEGYEEVGWASWYGEEFRGRRTSSGEVFDPDRVSAAHRTLPLPTWVEVTNLENGRSLRIRVNDRGPFADPDRRIIDVSRAAARRLGLIGPGTARVRVRALSPAELARDGRPGPLGGSWRRGGAVRDSIEGHEPLPPGGAPS